jgi:hypothetical protein
MKGTSAGRLEEYLVRKGSLVVAEDCQLDFNKMKGSIPSCFTQDFLSLNSDFKSNLLS